MNAGIHILKAEAYHRDPCDTPSLSASIAKILIQDSPLHAWTQHPRLNPNFQREDARHLDLGSLCHALLLEGSNVAHVIQATNKEGETVTDYRTKAAQQERDAARAAGKYPILAHEYPDVIAMLKACRAQLDVHAEASDAFTDGTPEATIIWQESNGVYCRMRADWLSHDRKRCEDYKTTAGSAHPDQVSRTMLRDGWDIQQAFYLRGLRSLGIHDATFRFVVQETYAPYALSVAGCQPSVQALANEKVEWAIRKFGECLQSGKWNGYTDRIAFAELPGWMEEQWLTREK